MKPPRPHPLVVRASALARLRRWPTVWSIGRQGYAKTELSYRTLSHSQL